MKLELNDKVYKLSEAQRQQVENLMNDESAFLAKSKYYGCQRVISYRTGELRVEACFNRPTLDALIKRDIIVEVKLDHYKLNPNIKIV